MKIEKVHGHRQILRWSSTGVVEQRFVIEKIFYGRIKPCYGLNLVTLIPIFRHFARTKSKRCRTTSFNKRSLQECSVQRTASNHKCYRLLLSGPVGQLDSSRSQINLLHRWTEIEHSTSSHGSDLGIKFLKKITQRGALSVTDID